MQPYVTLNWTRALGGARCRSGAPAYAEADSISIAENVLKFSLVRIGSSASYDRFLALAEQIP